jgi:hypothetical protein
MKKIHMFLIIPMLAAALLVVSSPAWARNNYEVSVTNMTRDQSFTPILAATHKKGVKLFTPGSPASPELAILAEGGDTVPLEDLLLLDPMVGDTATSAGLLGPGETVTIKLPKGGGFNHISLAAMLIPTNDAFIALNGVKAPRGNKIIMYLSPAYDAGSEDNDEDCANIPGPVCGGEGSNAAGGEGYVHIHAGIHGIGGIAAADYDWRNPVARIVIQRKPE